MSSHTEAAYNKYLDQPKGKGTLIGNWNEERSLREFTGVGRRIVREHIPKQHCNFEVPIETDKEQDNTMQRIYGERKNQPMFSETYAIGKSSNPADAIPKVGKKTLQIEQEIAKQVAAELAQTDQETAALREQRHWETTTKTTFPSQDYQQNTIGRRQMRTQDGAGISINERDEQLIVEHGTWRRQQKCPDEELWQRIPKGDYTQTQPVTHWTHTQDRKNYYMSAAVGSNPFARTSGFTQTADQVKSVSGYYGNIDFQQEENRVDFRKSVGTDLNQRNPYQEKEVSVTNFSDLTARVIRACKARSAANGLRSLRVIFRSLDKDCNGLIDPVNFKYGLRTLGCEINEDELRSLMKFFDETRSGKIGLNDVLHAMRSSSLNDKRLACVEAIYKKLDRAGNEKLTISDLVDAYNVTPNPEYQTRQKSENQLKQEFVEVWESNQTDAVISQAEFIDYFKDVSPSIISDNVFENLVANSFNC